MKSTIRVLGCSGGISEGLRTTSLLLNEDTLIDAGTGVGDLSIEALKKIDQVFLTHSHLDHVCSIAFMVDAVGALREKPLVVYGIRETIEALKAHIFNNVIWPDFTVIPSAEKPFLAFKVIGANSSMKIGEVTITTLPVDHSVPATGYAIDSGSGKLVFSGDTGPCDAFWSAINALSDVRHVIIETSFDSTDHALAEISGHLSSTSMVSEIQKLEHTEIQCWVTHLKPDGREDLFNEVLSFSRLVGVDLNELSIGDVLGF